jgi:hypothetical protein
MIDNKSVKKMWVKPEVTGVSAMSDAQATIGKIYFEQEGTFDSTTYVGPTS